MSRKLMYFLWCITIFMACYVMVAMTTNKNDVKRKLIFMNGIDSLNKDIVMMRRDHALLFRKSLHVQKLNKEMITERPHSESDVSTNRDTGNVIVPKAENIVVIKTGRSWRNESDFNSTVIRRKSLEKLEVEERLRESYYKLRESKINPFNYKFLESGEAICDGKIKPYLVVLCMSKIYEKEIRQAIRETWGSVAKTKRWPGFQDELPAVKLVFLFGSHDNSLVKRTIIEDEKKRFGDIVVADFKDSYLNLTLKVMMGLKWVSNYCPEARFVVKIDQDNFLHVLNLINYLHVLRIPPQGFIVGYENINAKVLRNGRWGIDRTSFPLSTYPNYTNGNCYVISGNVIRKMVEAAEKMPYIWVEDVLITGIVRQVLGVKIFDHKGFARWTDKPPRLCGFHNGFRITATNTDNDRKRNLWKALSNETLRNCYDINKHAETM